MRNLSYSFAPDGTYFVFDMNTGQTLKRHIATATAARRHWITMRSQGN